MNDRVRQAFGAALALGTSELVLARMSSEPQTPLDIFEGLFGLLLIGVLPVWIIERWVAEGEVRRRLVALASMAAPFLVVTSIALMPLMSRGRIRVLACAIVIAGLMAAIRAWATLRRDRPVQQPLENAAWVIAAATFAWLVIEGRLPPSGLVASITLLIAIVGVLSMRVWGWPVAAIFAVGLALAPARPLEVHWRNDRPIPNAPDIILLVADTLRVEPAREMRIYQRLAAEGVTFENAQASSSWTVPAMASLHTGLRPKQHGAVRPESGPTRAIRDEVRTLAERLEEGGYDTAAINMSGFLAARGGFNRGFSTWQYNWDHHRWSLPRALQMHQARPTIARLLFFFGIQGRTPTSNARYVAGLAEDLLGRRRERPLFLWLHFMDPHLPYRHADESDLPYRQSVALDDGDKDVFLDPFWQTEDGLSAIWTGYRNESKVLDGALEDILDALGPTPEAGRIIVFVADHGEEFWEHGEFQHGHAMYQELVHVPLVIAGLPGRSPGEVEQRVVGHVDLAPTLLAAAGLPTDDLPGQDLARPLEDRPRVSENLYFKPTDKQIGVRKGRWKLIAGTTAPPKLYDLDQDPAETRDLSGQHPAVVKELLEAIAASGSQQQGKQIELTDEERAGLEALGYVE